MSLYVTIGVLLLEFLVLGICIWQDRKPIDPNRPRLFPYRLLMITMAVFILGTLAHVISLLTGQTVMPRNKIYK